MASEPVRDWRTIANNLAKAAGAKAARIADLEAKLAEAQSSAAEAMQSCFGARRQMDQATIRAEAAEADARTLRLRVDERNATAASVLGGYVEGKPTSAVNWIQRARALVAFESEHQNCQGFGDMIASNLEKRAEAAEAKLAEAEARCREELHHHQTTVNDRNAMMARAEAAERERDDLQSWHAWFFDRLNEAARAHFLEEDFHGNLTNEGNRTMVVRLLGNMSQRIGENYAGKLRAERERDAALRRTHELTGNLEAQTVRLEAAERERDEARLFNARRLENETEAIRERDEARAEVEHHEQRIAELSHILSVPEGHVRLEDAARETCAEVERLTQLHHDDTTRLAGEIRTLKAERDAARAAVTNLRAACTIHEQGSMDMAKLLAEMQGSLDEARAEVERLLVLLREVHRLLSPRPEQTLDHLMALWIDNGLRDRIAALLEDAR